MSVYRYLNLMVARILSKTVTFQVCRTGLWTLNPLILRLSKLSLLYKDDSWFPKSFSFIWDINRHSGGRKQGWGLASKSGKLG